MVSTQQYLWGRRACSCMVATKDLIEDKLRKVGAIKETVENWMVAQGGYSNGSLSADTHAGGGAVDVWFLLVDTDAKVRAWRECGVAMWPRTGTDSASFGGNNKHGHGLWVGCPHLSNGAANQVRSYLNGRNGLVSNRADRYAHLRPSPQPTWQQALAQWRKPDVAKPIEKKEEIVIDNLKLDRTVNKTVPANKWTVIPINEKWETIGNWSEDKYVVGEVAFTAQIKPTEYVRARFFAINSDDKRVYTWPDVGVSHVWEQSRQLSTKVNKGHRIGFEILTPAPVKVTRTVTELNLFAVRG